jgi:hypothetical protein
LADKLLRLFLYFGTLLVGAEPIIHPAREQLVSLLANPLSPFVGLELALRLLEALLRLLEALRLFGLLFGDGLGKPFDLG